MSGFAAMTNQELRVWIAARLGWTDIRVNQSYPRIISGTPPTAVPVETRNGFVKITTVEQENTPNWPELVDTALTLLPVDRMWRIETYGKSVDFEIFPDDGERGSYSHAEIITVRQPRERLARAICEAWAQMMEAQPRPTSYPSSPSFWRWWCCCGRRGLRFG